MIKKVLVVLTLSAVLGISLFAAGKEVVLYTSNKPEQYELVASEFENQTGIKVSVVRAGTGTCMQRIVAESERPLCDVFWSGGIGTLEAYKEYFEPYRSPEAAAIPEGYVSPDDQWAVCMIHLITIMYNKDLVSEAEVPTKWEDLFDPKWRGKIAMANPVTSGSGFSFFYSMVDLYGWQGVRKLASNAVVQASSSSVWKGVYLGEYSLGIALEYAAYTYIAGGAENIGIVYPEEGVVVVPEGLVLVKGAPHPEEAKLFFDFLITKEIRESLLMTAYRRPIRTDIDIAELVPGLPSFEEVEIAINEKDVIEDMAARRDVLLERWTNLLEEVS